VKLKYLVYDREGLQKLRFVNTLVTKQNGKRAKEEKEKKISTFKRKKNDQEETKY
jgi:hypothetical protein